MIATENLVRNFGNITAVDGISFSVNKGEVLGFLGPNGAGKSTTMKMITGFLSPSSGTASVGGFDIQKDPVKVKELIGYLPENAPLYGEMTVANFLKFVAEIRSISDTNSVDRAVELTSLQEVQNQRIETLSKGFKRRVGLAQSILHDPEYLILDEPTDGLDPNQKHDVRKLINQMAEEKCIILSTHILEEVEEVCTRAIIVSKGKIVADDAPETLKRSSPSFGAVTVTFRSESSDRLRGMLENMSDIKEIHEFELGSGECSYTLFPKESSSFFSVLQALEGEKETIENIKVEDGKLDEVFRNITE